MRISISICPTEMEVGGEGHLYDEAALLEAIREFIEARLGKLAEIVCLQVGHRQGDRWARIDGDEQAGAALLADFFEDHGTDESLFVRTVRWPTIRNCNFSTREDDRGRHVYEALLAADRGCDDCDLIGALDALENTLEHNAERGSAEAEEACIDCEEAVEAALLAISAAFEGMD